MVHDMVRSAAEFAKEAMEGQTIVDNPNVGLWNS